jgi:cell division protein FtsL
MSAATVVPRTRPAARRVTMTSRAARPAPTRAPVRRVPGTQLQLRVVDATAVRRKRRARVGLWLLTVVVTASLVAVVAFHVVVAQGQLEIDRIEERTSLQQERYQELRSLVAQQSSPEEIARRAKELGLVEPAGPPTSVSGPPDPATPPPSSIPSTTDGWETVKPHLDPTP